MILGCMVCNTSLLNCDSIIIKPASVLFSQREGNVMSTVQMFGSLFLIHLSYYSHSYTGHRCRIKCTILLNKHA